MTTTVQSITAVILVGIHDFGRYPLRSRLPQALWPLAGQTLLQRMIDSLVRQGVRRIMVCAESGIKGVDQSVVAPEGVEVVHLSQPIERGSAGCLYDAAQRTSDERLLLCQSNLLRVPDLSGLIAAHEQAGADVTMAICPDGPAGEKGGDWADGGLAPFVLCNRSIIETVPSEGYCDFNEELLPQLIRAGKVVQSFRLAETVGSFHGWRQYLEAAGGMMQSLAEQTKNQDQRESARSQQPAVRSCSRNKPKNPISTGNADFADLDSGPPRRVRDLRRNDNEKTLLDASDGLPLTADLSPSPSSSPVSSLRPDLLPSAFCLLPDLSPIPDRPGVWAGREVRIHPTAKIVGPVALCDQVQIAEKAIVIGPCILGPGSLVGSGSVVSGSVSWDGVQIGPDCRITSSVLTYKVNIPRGSVIEGQLHLRPSALEKHPKRLARMADTLKDALGMNDSGNGRLFGTGKGGLSPVLMAGLLLVAAAFGWAYWNPTLAGLWEKLTQSDEYSSGLLVPLIAIYVTWIRRAELRAVPIIPAVGLGLAALAVAQVARFAGLYLGMDSGENLSVVLTVWAVLLLMLGWRMIWKTRAILLFLLLTLPLPNQVQSWITLPLQRWSSSSAVFSLEALGYAVQQQGNIIDINGTQVGVAEACNGLRMVTAFFVIAGFIALIVRRSGWQKFLVFVSSVPIALVCNTIRLTVTTIAFTMIKATTWEKAFHDFGGLAMMPLALAMIVAELWILSKLVVSEAAPRPEAIVYRR